MFSADLCALQGPVITLPKPHPVHQPADPDDDSTATCVSVKEHVHNAMQSVSHMRRQKEGPCVLLLRSLARLLCNEPAQVRAFLQAPARSQKGLPRRPWLAPPSASGLTWTKQ